MLLGLDGTGFAADVCGCCGFCRCFCTAYGARRFVRCLGGCVVVCLITWLLITGLEFVGFCFCFTCMLDFIADGLEVLCDSVKGTT